MSIDATLEKEIVDTCLVNLGVPHDLDGRRIHGDFLDGLQVLSVHEDEATLAPFRCRSGSSKNELFVGAEDSICGGVQAREVVPDLKRLLEGTHVPY
jgi:hypothetical protein